MNLNSPLQLEQCVVRELVLEVKPSVIAKAFNGTLEKAKTPQEAKVNVSYQSRPHAEAPKYWVSYAFEMVWPEEAATPYRRIAVSLDGVFVLPQDMSQEERDKFVPLLCLTCLHGHARGILATATGSCPGGPFQLPMVNMNTVVHAGASKKEADGKTGPRPKRVSRKKPSRTKAPKAPAKKKASSKKARPAK